MAAADVPLQQILYEEIKDAPPPQATPLATGSIVMAAPRARMGMGASVPPHPITMKTWHQLGALLLLRMP